MPQGGSCEECGMRRGMIRSHKTCPLDQGGCGRTLCKKCLAYACMTEQEAAAKGLKGRVSTFCKSCFQSLSILDFGKTEECLGPAAGDAPAILYVHGAGGCRTMFSGHASAMCAKGYRCVLMDLPSHGGRMDEKITLSGAIESIANTLRAHAPPCNGKKAILIGGSLGGYIGMEFLAVHGDMLAGAVIMMCGQNVGVGRGCAAGCGLWAMKALIPSLSSATLLTSLVGAAKKNGNMQADVMVRDFMRAGMFFGDALGHVAILKQTDPATALAAFEGPVLFLNGTLDHRDSEKRWRDACSDGTLIDYDGGDHFFSHDTRFDDQTVADVSNWAAQKGLVAC